MLKDVSITNLDSVVKKQSLGVELLEQLRRDTILVESISFADQVNQEEPRERMLRINDLANQRFPEVLTEAIALFYKRRNLRQFVSWRDHLQQEISTSVEEKNPTSLSFWRRLRAVLSKPKPQNEINLDSYKLELKQTETKIELTEKELEFDGSGYDVLRESIQSVENYLTSFPPSEGVTLSDIQAYVDNARQLLTLTSQGIESFITSQSWPRWLAVNLVSSEVIRGMSPESAEFEELVETQIMIQANGLMEKLNKLHNLLLQRYEMARDMYLSRIEDDAVTLIKQANIPTLDKKNLGEALISAIVSVASKLGIDEVDERMKFIRGRGGVVSGVYSSIGLGETIKLIDEQREDGMDLRGSGRLVVFDSLDECCPDLVQAKNHVVIDHAKLRDSLDAGEEYLELAGTTVDLAQVRLIFDQIDNGSIDRNPSVSVCQVNDGLSLVLEHDVDENLRLAYTIDLEIREQKGESALRLPTGEVGKSLNVSHLVLIDKESGKAIDLKTIVPDPFSLKFVPDPTTNAMRAEYGEYSHSKDKFVQFSNLSGRMRILALFHEIGHNILTAHLDEKLARESEESRAKALFGAGAIAELEKDPERYYKVKRLMSLNERGSSTHALAIMRELKRSGIDLRLTEQQASQFIDSALATYEHTFSMIDASGRKPFLSQEKLKRKLPAIDSY